MAFAPRGLTPLVGVFDMAKSLAFYEDLLGFDVVMASPEVETAEGRFSHWMLLQRGPVQIMLNTQYDSNERPASMYPARQAAHGDTSFYIGCSDIDEAYAELVQRGLKVAPPQRAPYELKVFSAVDPDGYNVIFQEER